MWVPIAVVAMAVLLRHRAVRRIMVSESILVLALALLAVVVLFEFERLA